MDLAAKKQYIDKINEQNHLLAFQKIVLDISFEFMNINQENFDGKVDHLLENIGTFFEVDRTYLFINNYEKQTMIFSHECYTEGISYEMIEREDTPLSFFLGAHPTT